MSVSLRTGTRRAARAGTAKGARHLAPQRDEEAEQAGAIDRGAAVLDKHRAPVGLTGDGAARAQQVRHEPLGHHGRRALASGGGLAQRQVRLLGCVEALGRQLAHLLVVDTAPRRTLLEQRRLGGGVTQRRHQRRADDGLHVGGDGAQHRLG